MAVLVLAMALNAWRLMRGPAMVDRILALDTLYINTIALLVLLGMQRATAMYFEAALLIALLGFVSTVVLSKFLLRGDIVE
jgi:multicomponent K+:H+ antiporter subunit F